LTACSVFRGGIALANVEAVYAAALDSRVPVLDSLQELVDHSLLRLASPSARYSMLETVREFAAEQLPSRPECSAIHAAHAAQFSRLADGLARPPRWPAKDGLDFLELEHDNFRAALDWYRHHDPSAGLLLANRLTAFWSARGHFSEGRWRLAELLEAVPDTDPGWVDGMNGAAWLATDQGDSVTAIDLLDRSVAGAHAAGDTVGEATALFFRGRSRLTTADRAGGSADMARAMELQRAAGDEAGLAAALWFAALPEMFEGQVDVAAERLVRSAQLSDALGIPALAARSWQLLGVCRVEQGDLSAAQAALERAVPAIVDIGDRFGIPVGLSALAGLAAKRGRARTAVKLAGAAAAQEEVHQSDRPIALRMFLDAWLAPAQTQLGAAAAPVFDEGRKLRLDEAVALGLGDDDDRLTRDTSSGLTRRESEVAGLVARGLTNREIAGQLHLSVRTVEVHVDHILTKLGFRTRTQLAGWAHQQGVLPGKDT
jgi:non-specific serine/threonine protein kinase